MRKIRSRWEELQRAGCPGLRDDVELEVGLALLDFYIMPCIEEFITYRGKLAPGTIVHLRNCKCELASLLKQSNGVVPCYFEDLLRLSREVLRRVKIEEARLIVAREAEREKDRFLVLA
jgi:hypothetical protein